MLPIKKSIIRNKWAYRNLREQEVIALPSERTLRKVTQRLDPTSSNGLSTEEYLKIRINKLNQFERTVMLVMDEIYISRRVEYSRGKILGFCNSGKDVASTVLVFMIRSVIGKYRDVVSIVPVNNLTAVTMHNSFNVVMRSLLHIGFSVVATSVDNNRVNSKFYKLLCLKGDDKRSVVFENSNNPTFLLFDSTHNFKNIYNNFLNKEHFDIPEFSPICGRALCAEFKDVKDIYQMECKMPLKLAHKLTEKCIAPKPIERSSVKMSAAVFHESTCAALLYYKKTDTADFANIVRKYWSVVSVNDTTIGCHKRDICKNPVSSSFDWKLQYLRQFEQFLAKWENTCQGRGLTKDTFAALRHTSLALADLATYLIDKANFNYVLLGRFVSDCLESRFGWYRQSCGGNYYISMRQLVESERKIKCISLLKFSELSIEGVDETFSSYGIVASQTKPFNCEVATVAQAIADDLMESLYSPSMDDANVVYYVSGYIAYSILKLTTCSHCEEILVLTEDIVCDLEIENLASPTGASQFLDIMTRGGLKKPTDYVFSVCLKLYQIYQTLQHHPKHWSTFLSSERHCSLFMDIASNVLQLDEEIYSQSVGRTHCASGHSVLETILMKMFNCLAKNFVKSKSDEFRLQDCGRSNCRKIMKLQSGNTLG